MVPYWLKPNRIGVALFIVSVLFILSVFSGYFIFFLLFFLELFGIVELFGWFFRFIEHHEHIIQDWRWLLCLISSLFAYPISMIFGKRIETKRKLRNGQPGIEPKAGNRKLEWLAFIAFLIIVAIPLDLGCFLLEQASYPYLTPPPDVVPPRPIDHWPFYVIPIALPVILMIFKWNISFVITLTTAILLERFCAELAFHTIGEVVSGLYYFATWPNIIPILLYSVEFRKTALAIILAIALLIIPYNLFLGYRFIQLQKETKAIVEYVYEMKAQTGSYPKDLSGYEFKNPHLEKHIQRYDIRGNEFTLSYYVGTTGTSHWYDSKDGWHYYPD